MTFRFRFAAGATTLLLCAQYLVAEAIAAHAWTSPYSYSQNFISDLGITRCADAGPCSPLADVMNAGFILSGLLAMVAAALLLPMVARPVGRIVLMGLATLHGIGSVIVGLVHSAPGTAPGTPHLHVLGAYAAIVGGNMALVTAGVALSPAWTSHAFRRGSIVLGLCGIASGLALVGTRGVPPGLLERGAVDTITVWEVAAGGLLALRLRRSRQPRPVTTTA